MPVAIARKLKCVSGKCNSGAKPAYLPFGDGNYLTPVSLGYLSNRSFDFCAVYTRNLVIPSH